MLNESDRDWLTEELGATYALLNKPLLLPALVRLVDDLSCYGRPQLSMALARVRMEHTGTLTPASIVHYVEQAYGRLPPSEAYALAVSSRDEHASVVWNNEISQAWGRASSLMDEGDRFGARQAFMESYEQITSMARFNGLLPQVEVSWGRDKQLRMMAVEAAQRRGLLSTDLAQLPPLVLREIAAQSDNPEQVLALLPPDAPNLLPAPVALSCIAVTPEQAKERLRVMCNELRDPERWHKLNAHKQRIQALNFKIRKAHVAQATAQYIAQEAAA